MKPALFSQHGEFEISVITKMHATVGMIMEQRFIGDVNVLL